MEDKRTPGLQGEVLGADTTGPAVASRYNSFEMVSSDYCPNATYLLSGAGKHCPAVVGVGHQLKTMGDSTAAGGGRA